MLTLITALAAGAAAQTAQPAPAANPHAQHMAIDKAKMDHSKMDHSKMDHKAMGKDGESCCKPGADGKMACMSGKKAGAGSANEGHSGH